MTRYLRGNSLRFTLFSSHLTCPSPATYLQVSILTGNLPFPVDLPPGFYLCSRVPDQNIYICFFILFPPGSPDPLERFGSANCRGRVVPLSEHPID